MRNFFIKIPRCYVIFCASAISALLVAGPVEVQAEPKRLAVLPFEILSDKPMDFLSKGIRSMLASRLAGADISIIDEAEVAKVLTGGPAEAVTDQSAARQAAGALGADYALFGTITAAAGGYSLDLTFLNMTLDPPKTSGISDAGSENQLIPRLAQVAHQVRGFIEGRQVGPAFATGPSDPAAGIQAGPFQGLFSSIDRGYTAEGPGQMGLFHRSRERTGAFSPSGSFTLPMGPMGLDVADLNGDGSPEILVVGRKNLVIYGLREGRYAPLGRLDSPFGEDFLKVSVGDINGSGRPEIYVVGRYGMRARTSVYEWQGAFKLIDRTRGHLCVVNGPEGTRPVLVYQGSNVSEFHSGPLHWVSYKADGKPAIGDRIQGLEDARLYSLARGDLDGNGVTEWVGVDKDKRLMLWGADGAQVWRGSTRISGSNNAISSGEIQGHGDPQPSVEFDPRVILADLDGNGVNEVIAARNIPISEQFIEYLVYIKSTITAYSLEGSRLVESWSSREIPYCLTDLKVHNGIIYISAEEGRIEKMTQGAGRIMWFE